MVVVVVVVVFVANLYGLLSFIISQILDYILKRTTGLYTSVAHKRHMDIEMNYYIPHWLL